MPFQTDPTSRHSYDTRRLVEMGLTIEIDTVWSFKHMQQVLQRELEGGDQALQHALRILARDHGREFKNIRTVGYLRLSDEGIVGEAGNDRASVTRRVRRASLRSGNIQAWDRLAEPLKREIDAHRSILALMRHIVTPKSMKQVRAEVNRARDELPLAETLRLFRKEV